MPDLGDQIRREIFLKKAGRGIKAHCREMQNDIIRNLREATPLQEFRQQLKTCHLMGLRKPVNKNRSLREKREETRRSERSFPHILLCFQSLPCH